MKRFQAMAQRITAFVLSAGMMASAAAPTVLAAQQAPSAPLDAENSVDELGNVDVSDDDGTLVYPEWDDEVTADFPDEDLDIEEPEEELPDEDVSADPESQIVTYGNAETAASGLVLELEIAFRTASKNPSSIQTVSLALLVTNYMGADAAVNALSNSFTKKLLRKRVDNLAGQYQKYVVELADRQLKEVESALKKQEENPGAVTNDEIVTVSGLYQTAKKTIE